MNKLQMGEQFFRALQMFAASLSDEKALEVATIYDPWKTGKVYAVGDYVTFGANSVGDPQLYKVISPHTSAAEWTPDVAVSLYDAIGLNNEGFPVWSQPSGAHDAYNTGDIVEHNGTLYISEVDGNTWEPGVYGWVEYAKETAL